MLPAHPRTVKCIEELGMSELFKNENLIIIEPLDYFSFQKLVKECKFIITDSGGIQEESTFRKLVFFHLCCKSINRSPIAFYSIKLY